MPGKIAEMLESSTQIGYSERLGTTATTYYNGRSITTSAIGIDMAEYEQAHYVLNVGTVLGEIGTLKNSIYHSQTNDPTTAGLLTGAAFTDRNSANDETIEEGSVLAGSSHRYQFLVTEIQGTPVTADFGAIVNLRAKAQATSKTLAFDL